MSDREQALTPRFIARLWLLGALFLVSVPHLLRMPLWLSAACFAIFSWRLLHELRGYDLPGRTLRYLLVFAGIGAVALVFRSLVGQEAGVALLTVMLCLKLLELHTLRDAMIALFIGYFMVIGGLLFSQSIFMGGYLLLVVLALTAALVALNHPSGESEDNRLYLGTGVKLLLQAMPLMVVMFILFPRLSGPLWSMPEDLASARTGLADSIEMGSISNLVESSEVAFRVDFKGAIPPADTLYWRGPVLWQSDGKRWERMPMEFGTVLPEFEPRSAPLDYTVTLEASNRRWIFALDLPLALPQGLNEPVFVRPDFQLLASRDISGKVRYRVRSATRYRLAGLRPWMERAATRLPEARNPQTRRLARSWRDQGLSDSAMVQRAYKLFREQPFYYTRQPPKLGAEPVDEFLFTTRRGFCEHYAAAFVTLMRAAGIPARIVTGYQGGERNELGDYLIVRQSNAHAWTEVWLDEQGWVRVDPTTAVPPERVEAANDAARFRTTDVTTSQGPDFPLLRKAYWQLRHSWDALNHGWNQWVLGFDRNKQRELLEKLGLRDLSWKWLIGLMAGLIAAVLGVITALTLLRRPRQRDPVLRLYQQFCNKLEKVGIIRQLDEGPADFAERAVAERPELEAMIRRISQLYIRLRYTRHRRGEGLETLRRMVKGFKA